MLRSVLLALGFIGFAGTVLAQTPAHTPPAGMTCPGDHLV